MHNIKSIAFIINKNKPHSTESAEYLESVLKKYGITVDVSSAFPVPTDFLKGKDLCCVFGGDGSILSVVNECTKYNVPVLGINHGKLGFLATFSHDEVEKYIPDLLKGHFQVESRSILECFTADGQHAYALNDIVIKQTSISSLAQLEVSSNNERITEYYCDGLIFSTPTGSTAHNLSAFGPIVYPDAKVIIMTPICPHTLTNRSVIFDHKTQIEVRSYDDPNLGIAVDGNLHFISTSVFPIKITSSKLTFPLVKMNQHSHSEILRKKLKWG